MKELVEVIAKSLVDNPDEVVVTEKESRRDFCSIFIKKISLQNASKLI